MPKHRHRRKDSSSRGSANVRTSHTLSPSEYLHSNQARGRTRKEKRRSRSRCSYSFDELGSSGDTSAQRSPSNEALLQKLDQLCTLITRHSAAHNLSPQERSELSEDASAAGAAHSSALEQYTEEPTVAQAAGASHQVTSRGVDDGPSTTGNVSFNTPPGIDIPESQDPNIPEDAFAREFFGGDQLSQTTST